MTISEYNFDEPEALVSNLADFIETELRKAIEARGRASLVVSGGSTPQPLFRALAARMLPWDKVTITLADERWVDSASEDSNENMVRNTLLTRSCCSRQFCAVEKFSSEGRGGGRCLQSDDCEHSKAV